MCQGMYTKCTFYLCTPGGNNEKKKRLLRNFAYDLTQQSRLVTTRAEMIKF